MTSKQALWSISAPAAVQTDSRPTGFLDLPLEVRIMIYTEITTRPENHYVTDETHLEGKLPAIFHTSSQMTSEIYHFCTVTATFKHKIIQHGEGGIFWYLVKLRSQDFARKLIDFNAQAHHKGILLNIMLRCTSSGCLLEGERCSLCRFYAGHAYSGILKAVGLERRFIPRV